VKISLSNERNSEPFVIISLICSCIIPLLVTGPLLPDLLVSTLSVWFIFYSIKNKIYWIYKNIFFYFFIGFCLVCILSSFLSEDILLSLKSSLFYVRIGIFVLLISYLIDKCIKIIEFFYISFLITFAFLIIDGYFQYFTGSNLFGYPIYVNRVSSFFGDELILGSYVTRLYPLLLALFLYRQKKYFFEVYYILILFFLLYILVLFSGERASFFLLNISILFIFVMLRGYKLIKSAFFILILCTFYFLMSANDKVLNHYIKLPANGLFFYFSKDNNNPNLNKKYLFTEGHDYIFRTSWNMFLDKPILGHGPKLFRIKCKDPKYAFNQDSCSTHSHNFYIQLLAETGILGFLFLAGLFIYFFFQSIKYLFYYFFYKIKLFKDYQICLLAGLLITIWPFTTNGNIFNNYLMILYSLQLGFFRMKY
jgi:O-antigen ligase